MRRPVLAPGLRVLRRSRSELQVGLGTSGTALRLPDSEPVRRTLDQLARGEAVPDDPHTRPVLDLLAPVLVDGSALLAPGVAPGDVAAVALRDPGGYRDRLAARARASVSVQGSLGSVDAETLLDAAGLRRAGSVAPVVLLLCLGEVDRADLDPLVRAGTPHVLVRLVEGTAVAGPFVVPGRTACVRCIDAHLADQDPTSVTLAARHAWVRHDRRDGVAEPVDTALATLAIAWAVRDLVSHVEGDRPSTWSTTVHLAPGLTRVTQATWLRHPACGCTWLGDEASSRTMEG